MEVSGQLHVPAALSPRKEPRYPLSRRLAGPQNQSGQGVEEENSQPRRESNPDHPIIQPVAIPALTTVSCENHNAMEMSFKMAEDPPYSTKVAPRDLYLLAEYYISFLANRLHEADSLFTSSQSSSLPRNSQSFMKPEGSLSYSQEFATGPNAVSVESTAHTDILFI
jgi:hypothetical protein